MSWGTLITRFLEGENGTYHLRPELKNLRVATLFIWGDDWRYEHEAATIHQGQFDVRRCSRFESIDSGVACGAGADHGSHRRVP